MYPIEKNLCDQERFHEGILHRVSRSKKGITAKGYRLHKGQLDKQKATSWVNYFWEQMSGQYVRLRDSKRNELIANFQEGIQDPEYEVIPNKTTKGKYTIRKRKVPLPEDAPKEEQPVTDEQPETVPQNSEEPPEEPTVPEDYNPYLDDQNYLPSFKMNKNAMFREMQMQINRMFIENMKMMRSQLKQSERKRLKLKEKSGKISNMLSSIVEQAEREEAEAEDIEGEVEVQEPTEPQEPKQEEPTVQKEYANDYEQNLDMMAGDVYATAPSRRNRLHTEKFGIWN